MRLASYVGARMVSTPTDAEGICKWGASLPRTSDLRYSWALARLDRLDADEARELVLDAWDWWCHASSPSRCGSRSTW